MFPAYAFAWHSNVIYMPCEWLNVPCKLIERNTFLTKSFKRILTGKNGALANHSNAVCKSLIQNRATHHIYLIPSNCLISIFNYNLIVLIWSLLVSKSFIVLHCFFWFNSFSLVAYFQKTEGRSKTKILWVTYFLNGANSFHKGYLIAI